MQDKDSKYINKDYGAMLEEVSRRNLFVLSKPSVPPVVSPVFLAKSLSATFGSTSISAKSLSATFGSTSPIGRGNVVVFS